MLSLDDRGVDRPSNEVVGPANRAESSRIRAESAPGARLRSRRS